ncbi:MAG TPA: class I SAM-dependent methyltransferase [Chloroflexia bacterium]|nr:class I SAM-dependent methyltransferase [Chloroflexia bacterium]
MDEARQTVQAGYDHMADQYLARKDPADPTTLAALEQLASALPAGATVLDLGCGAGVPVTRWLAARYAVTGVDLSARQIELARQQVPAASFHQADMTTLEFPPASFDAVVAFYAIIHVPRAEQPALVGRIHAWLKPGGAFLGTWAMTSWEGQDADWEGWGAPMWWSHYDADGNLAMLRAAGFTITTADVRTDGGETWLWVLAHKAGGGP